MTTQIKIIHQLLADWNDDYSHLADLCIKAGYTEEQVQGDSHYVPSIQELANMLFAKIPVQGGEQ